MGRESQTRLLRSFQERRLYRRAGGEGSGWRKHNSLVVGGREQNLGRGCYLLSSRGNLGEEGGQALEFKEGEGFEIVRK